MPAATGFKQRTVARATTAWHGGSASTTRPTCSAATRTSGLRDDTAHEVLDRDVGRWRKHPVGLQPRLAARPGRAPRADARVKKHGRARRRGGNRVLAVPLGNAMAGWTQS